MIITLLEFLLDKNIIDFKYIGIQKFDSIIEYDFSLIKLKVLFKNNEHDIVYIRIIKGGKIKESIFCYWSFLHEQYLINHKDIDMPKKVMITEKSIENDRKNIILNLDKDLNYTTEIILMEIERFIIEKSKEKNNLKKLLDYLNKHDRDILFLGTIRY